MCQPDTGAGLVPPVKRAVTGLIAAGLLASLAVSPVQAAGLSRTPAASARHNPYGSPGKPLAVTRTVRITALDTLRFSPVQIQVHTGQTVRFLIYNSGRLTHEFVIGNRAEQQAHEARMEAHPGMKMAREPNGVTIPPGHTATLIWHFPEHAGTVEFACHEPGHFNAGMVGHIDIVPAGGHGKRRGKNTETAALPDG